MNKIYSIPLTICLTFLMLMAAIGALCTHNFALGQGTTTVVGGVGASPTNANTWTALQTFTGGVSSTAITNNTGLQLFNTTTTCTTAATINTPCTTAAITLPSGYADTNYRIVCNGLPAVTAFPQIQTITKSNTTFTITLNNLTAAAASYTSFDCLVAHN